MTAVHVVATTTILGAKTMESMAEFRIYSTMKIDNSYWETDFSGDNEQNHPLEEWIKGALREKIRLELNKRGVTN